MMPTCEYTVLSEYVIAVCSEIGPMYVWVSLDTLKYSPGEWGTGKCLACCSRSTWR